MGNVLNNFLSFFSFPFFFSFDRETWSLRAFTRNDVREFKIIVFIIRCFVEKPTEIRKCFESCDEWRVRVLFVGVERVSRLRSKSNGYKNYSILFDIENI